MPDILSHIVCAHEGSRNLAKNIRDIIDANKSIFLLGAQGPDIFYYYKVYPWQDSGDIEKYAELIHGNSPNNFFINGAKLIKDELEILNYNLLTHSDIKTDTHKKFTYLCGFLSHYALDTTAHPYIFYFSGINSSHNHKYYECIIDTIISNLYNAKEKKLNKTFKNIKLKKNEPSIISDFLRSIIFNTYNENVDKEIIKTSFNDIRTIMSIMYDPLSIKRSSFKRIDKMAKLSGKMITATYPAKLNKNIDYLNLKHNKWHHPSNKNMEYNTSFLDLFDLSIIKSNKYILNLAYYLENNLPVETFQNVIGNKLYDTGLEESLVQEMKYENIILDYKNEFKI